MSDPMRPMTSEIADRAVAMALDAGATQAEAVVVDSASALTRFANNELHQNVAEDDVSINLRSNVGRLNWCDD